MNTLKKIGFIIAIMIAGAALMTSCSKEPEIKGAKVKKTSAVVKTRDISPPEKTSLSAIRNGQYVTLTWQVDVAEAKVKKFDILRSATGRGQNQKLMAMLKSDATSYKDCLPDENAYSYWVNLVTTDGRSQRIGPARVDTDKAGAAGLNASLFCYIHYHGCPVN